MSADVEKLEGRFDRLPTFTISRLTGTFENMMWELTFRFFEAGGALCVGEESRSAIRGLGARLRSLRRVAGVDMMTPGQY